MIVATAGHIDHGKTSLVRALTGTDTDRLPEEKARGITIDLGFAYLRAPGGTTIGFVDVPGHERLVRTMMAGASGVDLALLVVAADDGVMPQTREHLAVLDLLGVPRGIVALTKSDRVDAPRLAGVEGEIRAALAGTALADAPIVACSSVTGDGIPEIARHLDEAARRTQARGAAGDFRLAVDRSFSLPGIGLVVTGTVHAGSVAAGDRLLLSPSGVEARVRGLHAQNQAQPSGTVGQRVALNLSTRAGREAIHRGDWILAPVLHAPTAQLDVRLRLLPAEGRVLKHWTPVHFHLGAASVTGRVALLEGGSLAPGSEAFAQIVLDSPVGALWGDRFALRDASAQRTIGGGCVLDPFAPPRRGRTLERLAILRAHAHEDHADALRAVLEVSPGGIDPDRFDRARNIADPAALRVYRVVIETAPPRRRLAFAPMQWAALRASLLAGVARHHALHADEWGPTAEELAATLDALLHPALPAALRQLTDDAALIRTGQVLHLPGRAIRLGAADAMLWDELREVLAQADLDPLRLAFIAERLRADEATVRPLAEKLARIGWLHRVSPAYFLLPETAARLADMARRVADENPERLLTVGRFREATGISRHATMPLLEFFDRAGLTRRVPEGRRVCEGGEGA